MKTKIFTILAFLSLISSCDDGSNSTPANIARKNPETGRLKVKEVIHNAYFTYEIVEVDGVEYLATNNGGLIPLVKN